MAAGQGFKTFATGDVLTAADTNGYLMQGVWVFADATARDAAVTSPQEGNTCYLKSTDVIQVYSGSAWVVKSGGSSPLTTKGDLYTYSTTDARLGVGTNGQVLTADSTAGTGLAWATAASGGITQLASGSMSGSTVSLTSISQSYNNLVLIGNAITPSSSGDAVALQVNGTGNNNFYASTLIDTTLSIGSANQHCGLCVGSGTLAQYFTATIFNYTSANAKQFQTQGYTVAGSNGKRTNWGTIIGTGAITSLQMNISSSFSAGTYILYGVK